jgi:hypothetical protein
MIRDAMRRALTPVEIDLLFIATKAINKLADGLSAPDKVRAKAEEALE